MKIFITILVILLLPIPVLSRDDVSCIYIESKHLTSGGFTQYTLTCDDGVIINKDNRTKMYMKFGKLVFDQSTTGGVITPEVYPDFVPAYISRIKEKVIRLRLPKE